MDTKTIALRVGFLFGLLGLACGILYSVGGFFYDLMTIGLNRGTALAFMALIGMPVLFGTIGLALGAVFGVTRKIWRRTS